jgi:phage terminase small subunit
MTLTAKQEKFAQCIADGMTQADAYRTAYSAGKMTDNAVYVKASQLMAEGKVSVRVAELRQALSDRLLWAREDSVRVLAKIADADEEAPHSAIVSAVKELNAMHGYHAPTQSNVNVNTSNPAAILSALERKHRDG